MKITFPSTLLALLLFNTGTVFAQATFNDPVPLSGNAAQSISGTEVINSAIRNSGKGTGNSKRSPSELAIRKAALNRVSSCRKEARAQYPAGDKRRYELTKRCKEIFEIEKATWTK